LNQSTFLGFDPIAITTNERLIAPPAPKSALQSALEDQVTLVNQVVEPLIENYVAVPSGIEFRSVHSHQTPECCMSTLAGKLH
jgi:hypothetical protein